jgi:galactokinase
VRKLKNNYNIYGAPARINLIGEHIDYNGGMVMPAAISLRTRCKFKLRDDSRIILDSENTNLHVERDLNDLEFDKKYDWANYPVGVVYTLIKKGFKIDKGFEIIFDSNIPLGSGLSSSASILVLTCYALNSEFNLEINNKDIALLAQETEVKYCGLSCGIMDEAIIALGKKNNAILLDCAKFEYDYIPIDFKDYTIAVLQTNKKRALTESKYNERVEECNKALSILKPKYNISNLCELKSSELDNIKALINDDVVFRRVKHVVKENERVYLFKDALINNDLITLGKLLNESHESLKNDYETSGMHLDTIVEASQEFKDCLGARMTGAGFGGCAIALVKKSSFDEFKKTVEAKYLEKTGINALIYLVDISDGPKKSI